MPKIIIREYDNTKAVNGATGNFSVVVPGVVDTGKGTTGFDSNGVCEVNTVENFETYIGKVKGVLEAKPAEEAVAPTLEAITSADTTAGCAVVAGAGIALCTCRDAQALASLWGNHSATGKVYTAAVDSSKTAEGYLVIKDGTNYYSLTAITTETPWVSGTVYCVVTTGSEGKDAVAAVTVLYNGNQIAYELIKAGYTVLYKKFNNVSELLTTGTNFFDCFKDKSTYDFRYISSGGLFVTNTGEGVVTEKKVYNDMIDIATYQNNDSTDGRGDCVALLDVNESIFTSDKTTINNIIAYADSISKANKYSAIFAPKVTYDEVGEKDYEYNTTFPASVDYLLCAAYARDRLNFNEWYAVAGYNRGVSEKTIKATSLQLGEIAINALQPRTAVTDGIAHSVNVITKIRGNYYLWGNRTAHALDANGLVASHFLNIRQLCSTLKKDIWNACKSLTFDPNSDVLWGTFCNKIKATLEKMKADQGIADYRILKVTSKVKAKLTAKVRIVPIEAVEDFEINIYLEDSLSGVDVTASE